MAIYVHRRGDITVTKAFGDDLCVYALINEQRGRCVAQIMEANVAKTVLFDELAKLQIGAFMMERRAIRMAENKMSFVAVLILTASPGVFQGVSLLDAISIIVPQFFQN